MRIFVGAMMNPGEVQSVLDTGNYSHSNLCELLSLEGESLEVLFERARELRKKHSGNKVYFRGLIELSNICSKNCYYCGVRRGNKSVERYFVTDEEVLEAARYAHRNRFASMVLQSGERSDRKFRDDVSRILQLIHRETGGELHITLSMGEQSRETYEEWFNIGAHRYLLRIEASDPELYASLHPDNALHDYQKRVDCIRLLRDIGYQAGTGVMIGLPFQEIEHLASDLLFFREMDIDMVGMGPYIEHEDTPLYRYRHLMPEKEQRFILSMKMVALLRIMMPDINIAATTAMQTLKEGGREFALKVGANVVMPNLTPPRYRENYLLYNNKPGIDQDAEDSTTSLEALIHAAGMEVGYGEWGDSAHYRKRG